MVNIIQIIVAVFLVLHGLVHFMGPAVYLKLVEIEGFRYKTTLLGRQWDIGDNGIRLFGILWILPALGFILVAVALVLGFEWWQTALIAVTLFSLVLSLLDWSVAYAGAAIDVLILAVVFLVPRIAAWLAG